MGIEKQFETGQTPHLIFEQIRGNMVLTAWDEPRVTVNSKGDNYRFKQEGNEIRLSGFEDCHINVPSAASVTLGDVYGNAKISGVRGQLIVQVFHGNFRGSEVGETRVGRVGGECSLNDVAGPLVLGNVGGNVQANDVSGIFQLEQCGGNCSLTDVKGEISLGRVHGNLNSNGIQSLTVDSVSGNFGVRDADGKVAVRKVGGNLSIHESTGDVEAEFVGGEVKMRESSGSLQARCGGNAILNLQELTAPNITLTAGGDIRCRVPLDVNAKVDMRAGHSLVIKNLEMPNEWDTRHVSFDLGSGEGLLQLEAGNRIKLIGSVEEETPPEWDSDFEFQFHGDFNERATEVVQQLADQVEAQVEAFTRQLNERLSQLDSDAISLKVQQKVQSAIRQAEEKFAEARNRAERQAERQAERHAAREERRNRVRVTPPVPPMPPMAGTPGMAPSSYMASPPPQPAKPKRNPPSTEERMMVLKMLEEGKISVEQAEQLLAAMGE